MTMQDKPAELSPCPFCGTTLSVARDYDGDPVFTHPDSDTCVLSGSSWDADCFDSTAWNRRARPAQGEPLSLMRAMEIAEAGYQRWSDKPHNARWVRKIDGTPIQNDLVVNMAEEFRSALSQSQPAPSEVEEAFLKLCGELGIAATPAAWLEARKLLTHAPQPDDDAQIKHMFSRFLTWKLPDDFDPDGGISFQRDYNQHTPWPAKHEPVGANLLTAMQAEAMIRYILEGVPLSTPPTEAGVEQMERDGNTKPGFYAALDALQLLEHLPPTLRVSQPGGSSFARCSREFVLNQVAAIMSGGGAVIIEDDAVASLRPGGGSAS